MIVNYPKYQLQPSYCPLHGQDAPCYGCLGPEVAELVLASCAIGGVVFLYTPNMDQN